jgi:hypothetical protein
MRLADELEVIAAGGTRASRRAPCRSSDLDDVADLGR